LPAFVVDASVALKWVVAEESSDQAAKLLGAPLAAPALIEAECSNVLWAKARRGEMTPSEARRRSEFLMRVPIRLVPMSNLISSALALAFRLDQPVYDCLYLALAIDESSVLVTADIRFARATSAHAELRDRVLRLGDLR
jgi:predicted nucleic acid-binding protein